MIMFLCIGTVGLPSELKSCKRCTRRLESRKEAVLISTHCSTAVNLLPVGTSFHLFFGRSKHAKDP